MNDKREGRRGLAGGRGLGQSAWQGACTCDYSTAAQKRQIPVYNSAGRVVGHLTADGWLEKWGLDPDRHMLKRPAGWATDASHLDISGLVGVRIITTTGEVWEAPIEAWRRYGIPINRGHGAQVCLPLAYWRHSKGEACQLPLLGGEVTP